MKVHFFEGKKRERMDLPNQKSDGYRKGVMLEKEDTVSEESRLRLLKFKQFFVNFIG